MIIKVTHKSTKFGWGYSADSIKPPVSPDYTGTISKVWKAKKEDVEYQNLEGALWFFDGEPIKAISDHENTTKWYSMDKSDLGAYILGQFEEGYFENLYVKT